MAVQHKNKASLYVVFIITILAVSTIGPAIPANAELTKRGSFLNDQHLTVRFGNTKVCGDHMCGPGEWAKLQEDLANAQFGAIGKNQTQTTSTSNVTMTTPTQPTMTPPSNVTSPSLPTPTHPTMTPPSNVTTPTPPTPPMPTPSTQPTMTPQSQSTVCIAVKSVLALANASSSVVAKVMTDLGCS